MSLQPLENPLCANFNWQHTLSPVNILVIYSLIYLMVLWLDEFLLTPFRQDFYGPSMRCYISLSWKQFEFNTFSLLNFCSCMFALFIREVYGSKKISFFFLILVWFSWLCGRRVIYPFYSAGILMVIFLLSLFFLPWSSSAHSSTPKNRQQIKVNRVINSFWLKYCSVLCLSHGHHSYLCGCYRRF